METRATKIEHGMIIWCNRKAVNNLLFNEKIHEMYELKIKGFNGDGLNIQFLERGKPEPQLSWTFDEFKNKCEKGDFDDI